MAEKAAAKQRRGSGRPFEPGQSGNPAGKKVGTRHTITVLAEKLMGEDVEAVVQSVLTAAKAGDMQAARIIMDRVSPVRKGAAVPIALPPITTPDDVETALSAVTEAMAVGEISPDEAAVVAGVVELRRRAIETTVMERRLQAIEDLIGQRGKR